MNAARSLVLLLLGWAAVVAVGAEELDLGGMVQPPPVGARFGQEGFHVWCGAPVRTADGRCHLFYSRWPVEKGFAPGWALSSEIAYAVAERPEGPYRFVNVALPARGKPFWDGSVTHNPNVLQKDGKFYLFYMGNGDRYYAVARDVVGQFTGSAGGLALFESADGLQWKPAAHPKVLGDRFTWADGTRSPKNVERPALLFDGEIPVALFGATDGYLKTPSFNVQFPLKPGARP